MSNLLYYYAIGGLISAIIVLLCASITAAEYDKAIKTSLIVGLIWPIAWPLCIYMIINRRNKKQ